MAIAIIGKPIITRREFLKALRGDGGEIAGEFRIFRQNHRSSSHKAVNQRLLAHFFLSLMILFVSPKPYP